MHETAFLSAKIPRHRPRRRHGRTMNFFDAAARRLAWNDYEKVSVAMICRDARSTRYTFYRRFPNKQAFYYALVLVTFRSRIAAFSRAMHEFELQKPTASEIIARIVDEVIAGTMTVSGIGVTQLAVRIGTSKPKGAEPYVAYRKAVTAAAVDLLSPKLKGDNAAGHCPGAHPRYRTTRGSARWRDGQSQRRGTRQGSGTVPFPPIRASSTLPGNSAG